MNRSLSTSLRKRRMNFDTVRPFARWASQACSLTRVSRAPLSLEVFSSSFGRPRADDAMADDAEMTGPPREENQAAGDEEGEDSDIEIEGEIKKMLVAYFAGFGSGGRDRRVSNF